MHKFKLDITVNKYYMQQNLHSAPVHHRCRGRFECVNYFSKQLHNTSPKYTELYVLTVVFSPDACAYGLYDCHPNATCAPETNGWYYCQCNPGFNGDGRQCNGTFHHIFVERCFLATVYLHPNCILIFLYPDISAS